MKSRQTPVGQVSVPASSFVPPGNYRRKLPHLRREGATYFLTWRLNQQQADLLPEERSLVVEVLKHFDGQRYTLYGWVVMNDHIHVMVRPCEAFSLTQLTYS